MARYNQEGKRICDIWLWAFDEEREDCEECKHYHCEAFRKLKEDQERYEEDYL